MCDDFGRVRLCGARGLYTHESHYVFAAVKPEPAFRPSHCLPVAPEGGESNGVFGESRGSANRRRLRWHGDRYTVLWISMTHKRRQSWKMNGVSH